MATLCVGLLQVLLWVASLLPSLKTAYELEFAPLIPQASAKSIPLGFWALVTLAVPLGITFSQTGWPRHLDFLLLAPFDADVLGPIRRRTGVFLWHLPTRGEPRETWERLLAWATQALEQSGVARWQGRHLPAAERFRWALLLGGNGVGKSQLALELGRSLAQRPFRREGDAEPASLGLLGS